MDLLSHITIIKLDKIFVVIAFQIFDKRQNKVVAPEARKHEVDFCFISSLFLRTIYRSIPRDIEPSGAGGQRKEGLDFWNANGIDFEG